MDPTYPMFEPKTVDKLVRERDENSSWRVLPAFCHRAELTIPILSGRTCRLMGLVGGFNPVPTGSGSWMIRSLVSVCRRGASDLTWRTSESLCRCILVAFRVPQAPSHPYDQPESVPTTSPHSSSAASGADGHNDAIEQFIGDGDGQDAVDDPLIPICYYPGGIFAKERALDPSLERPVNVEGQDWRKLEKTRSTVGSVQRLFREHSGVGVTFIILRSDQRPWSQPVGYQCIYESFFGKDTKLWFPIPRLVTSYVWRRDVAISQLLDGSLRIVAALMVMAAEISISLNIPALEEMNFIKPMPQGIYSQRMRPNYNVIMGHPNKMQLWQRFYFYIKSNESAFEEPPPSDSRYLWNYPIGRLLLRSLFFPFESNQFFSCCAVDHPNTLDFPVGFFEDAHALAAHSHLRWLEISRERIRRALSRLEKAEWECYIRPVIAPGKSRINLFNRKEHREVKRARRMKTLPDLSTLIEKELDLPRNRLISMLDIMGLDGTSEANPQTKPPPSSVPEENVGHCGHDADWGKSEEEEKEEKLAEKPSESREGNVAREDDLESEPVNDPIVPTDTVPSTTQDASPPGLPLKREKKKKTDSGSEGWNITNRSFPRATLDYLLHYSIATSIVTSGSSSVIANLKTKHKGILGRSILIVLCLLFLYMCTILTRKNGRQRTTVKNKGNIIP
ncbi:unnamed protein product [Brassica oleracea var. botrytis]